MCQYIQNILYICPIVLQSMYIMLSITIKTFPMLIHDRNVCNVIITDIYYEKFLFPYKLLYLSSWVTHFSLRWSFRSASLRCSVVLVRTHKSQH